MRGAFDRRMPSMIEAWLRASETIRSVSPVIVGMTPVLAVKPDWKVRTAGTSLNAASSALERLVHRHRPGDRADCAAPRPELTHGLERGRDHPRVMGQPEVVVRREADQPPVVDRHDRALRRRHDPQLPVEVALPQGGDLVVEEGERVGAAGWTGALRHDVQSMMTLPESPARAASNAASYSRNPNRWVMAGVMSSPDWSMTVILYQVSYISRP